MPRDEPKRAQTEDLLNERAPLLGQLPRHPEHDPEHDPAAPTAHEAAAGKKARRAMVWTGVMLNLYQGYLHRFQRGVKRLFANFFEKSRTPSNPFVKSQSRFDLGRVQGKVSKQLRPDPKRTTTMDTEQEQNSHFLGNDAPLSENEEKLNKLIESIEQFAEMSRNGTTTETLRNFVGRCENLEHLARACDTIRLRSKSVSKVQELSRHLDSASGLWKPDLIDGLDVEVGQKLFELLGLLVAEVEKKTERAARIRADAMEIPILSLLWDTAPHIDNDYKIRTASHPGEMRREVVVEPAVATTTSAPIPNLVSNTTGDDASSSRIRELGKKTKKTRIDMSPIEIEMSPIEMSSFVEIDLNNGDGPMETPIPPSSGGPSNDAVVLPPVALELVAPAPELPEFDLLAQQTWTMALRSCTLQSWKFNCVAHGNIGHPTSGSHVGKGLSAFWVDEKDSNHAARVNLTHPLPPHSKMGSEASARRQTAPAHGVHLSIWILRNNVIEQSFDLTVPADQLEQTLADPALLIEKLR